MTPMVVIVLCCGGVTDSVLGSVCMRYWCGLLFVYILSFGIIYKNGFPFHLDFSLRFLRRGHFYDHLVGGCNDHLQYIILDCGIILFLNWSNVMLLCSLWTRTWYNREVVSMGKSFPWNVVSTYKSTKIFLYPFGPLDSPLKSSYVVWYPSLQCGAITSDI